MKLIWENSNSNCWNSQKICCSCSKDKYEETRSISVFDNNPGWIRWKEEGQDFSSTLIRSFSCMQFFVRCQLCLSATVVKFCADIPYPQCRKKRDTASYNLNCANGNLRNQKWRKTVEDALSKKCSCDASLVFKCLCQTLQSLLKINFFGAFALKTTWIQMTPKQAIIIIKSFTNTYYNQKRQSSKTKSERASLPDRRKQHWEISGAQLTNMFASVGATMCLPEGA